VTVVHEVKVHARSPRSRSYPPWSYPPQGKTPKGLKNIPSLELVIIDTDSFVIDAFVNDDAFVNEAFVIDAFVNDDALNLGSTTCVHEESTLRPTDRLYIHRHDTATYPM